MLAQSIAKPITRLTHATKAIAQGDYTHRVETTKDGEIGSLASSFNAMVEQVQRSRQTEKDFLANVSHELRTPLTSIQGFAQAILDGAVTDMVGAHRAAQTIFSETARMSRLIGDLLTIARLESGQLNLSSEQIDLCELLPRWVGASAAARAEKNAHARRDDRRTSYRSQATQEGLEQVFSNLVDNAIKYSPDGASVTVAARRESVTPTPRRRRVERAVERMGHDRGARCRSWDSEPGFAAPI